MKSIQILTVAIMLSWVSMSLGADDSSIQGQTRQGIQSAMQSHIQENLVDGKYVVYDAVKGELKRLKLEKLHDGIVKKSDYYVSCADFVDDRGSLYDLDLLVVQKDGRFQVLETVVHAIEGQKRKYHLED